MRKVYLAGPIEKVSFEDAKGWRKEAHKLLQLKSLEKVVGVDPYRNHGEDFLLKAEHRKDAVLINRRDKHLTRQCDIILANLQDPGILIGTLYEMGMFFERDLPIFGWLRADTKDQVLGHPMTRDMLTYSSTDLDDLCSVIAEFNA